MAGVTLRRETIDLTYIVRRQAGCVSGLAALLRVDEVLYPPWTYLETSYDLIANPFDAYLLS